MPRGYRLRLSHCPECKTTTAVPDSGWQRAWSDIFIDHSQWVAAGEPEGFLWGSGWSTAYPGLTYMDDSPRAQRWSERLGREMHGVRIATHAFEIRIVFNDFTVTRSNDTIRVVGRVKFPLRQRSGEEAS